MIGKRIRLKRELVPKMRWAIGTPDARVFFDPQNMAAILSSVEKCNASETFLMRIITIPNNASVPSMVIARGAKPWLDHTPVFIESQNEV